MVTLLALVGLVALLIVGVRVANRLKEKAADDDNAGNK